MSHRASDFDGFFGMAWATENGHEIWSIAHNESPQVREYKRSYGTRVTMNQQTIIHFSMEMGLGDGLFVHRGITSTVKDEFVSDRKPYV
jgi:hypothetical protein